MSFEAPADRAAALEAAIAELERAAARLRDGDLEADDAAALVEVCAELAGRLGGELDRAERAATTEPPASGQERLL